MESATRQLNLEDTFGGRQPPAPPSCQHFQASARMGCLTLKGCEIRAPKMQPNLARSADKSEGRLQLRCGLGERCSILCLRGFYAQRDPSVLNGKSLCFALPSSESSWESA